MTLPIKIKIIQHNLNNNRLAALQLREHCKTNKVSISLLQEPALNNGKIYGFEDCRQIASDDPGAAITLLDNDIPAMEITKHLSSNIATAKIGIGKNAFTIVSAYFKFNVHTTYFTDKLRSIAEDAGNKLIIGADTNGHSPRWFSKDRNARGVIVEDLVDDLALHIANRAGNIDTYSRPNMRASNIDVTFAIPDIVDKIKNWVVLDITKSDHRVIAFDISTYVKPRQVHNSTGYSFNCKKADWEKF